MILIARAHRADQACSELLLSKVEAIAVDQGLLARMLSYGDITVSGTGGAREVFRRVRDPIGLRHHVQQASLGTHPEGRTRLSGKPTL